MSAAVPLAAPATPASSRMSRAWARLRATGPAGIASAIVIAVAILMAVFGTLLAPYDPITPNLSLSWVGPVGGHLLGYDFEGRDVLSRIMVGARTALLGPVARSLAQARLRREVPGVAGAASGTAALIGPGSRA